MEIGRLQIKARSSPTQAEGRSQKSSRLSRCLVSHSQRRAEVVEANAEVIQEGLAGMFRSDSEFQDVVEMMYVAFLCSCFVGLTDHAGVCDRSVLKRVPVRLG